MEGFEQEFETDDERKQRISKIADRIIAAYDQVIYDYFNKIIEENHERNTDEL